MAVPLPFLNHLNRYIDTNIHIRPVLIFLYSEKSPDGVFQVHPVRRTHGWTRDKYAAHRQVAGRTTGDLQPSAADAARQKLRKLDYSGAERPVASESRLRDHASQYWN